MSTYSISNNSKKIISHFPKNGPSGTCLPTLNSKTKPQPPKCLHLVMNWKMMVTNLVPWGTCVHKVLTKKHTVEMPHSESSWLHQNWREKHYQRHCILPKSSASRSQQLGEIYLEHGVFYVSVFFVLGVCFSAIPCLNLCIGVMTVRGRAISYLRAS